MGFFKSVLGVGAAREAADQGSYSTTANPDDWYPRNGYYFDAPAYSSYSGHTISAQSAMDVAAFYSGVKVIAEDVGSLPFFLYERSKDGRSTEKAVGHPLFRVLHGLWHPELSSGEGIEAMTAQAAIFGNGYARIQRFGRDQIFLWPLPADSVRVDRDKRGQVVYIARESGRDRTYAAAEIFHLKGYTLNGDKGDVILLRSRQFLGMALAAQEFAGSAMKQGIHTDLFFEHPQPIRSETARAIEREFSEKAGTSKAGLPHVLREGMKAQRLDPDLEKWQLMELQKYQVIEVCRMLRLSPHKLADFERATFSNIEEANIDHIRHTLSPWVRRWKDAVYRDLLTRTEQFDGRLYAEHSVEAFMRGDFKGQAEAMSKLAEKGIYTINEIRRWFNLNPVEGGDDNRVQLNMTTLRESARAAVADRLNQAALSRPLKGWELEVLGELGGSVS